MPSKSLCGQCGKNPLLANRIRKSLITAILVHFIFLFPINKGLSGEIEAIGNDEFEIYSIVLLKLTALPPNPKLFVIHQFTSDRIKLDDQMVAYFEERTTVRLDIATIDDFNNKNAKTNKLKNNFNVLQKVVLISEQEQKKIFSDLNGWDRFYKKYPDASGITEVSRVGFNRDGTQGILYIGRTSGWEVGAGYLVPLAKKGDKWIIEKEVLVWIS